MLIESLKQRTGGTEIEIHGEKHHFQPNEQGHHVAEIANPATIHRLTVEIPDGFREYQKQQAAAPIAMPPVLEVIPQVRKEQPEAPAKPPAPPQKMVISNGESEIDLMTLDYDAAKLLAKETFGINVHHKWTVDTIRSKIIEATRVE